MRSAHLYAFFLVLAGLGVVLTEVNLCTQTIAPASITSALDTPPYHFSCIQGWASWQTYLVNLHWDVKERQWTLLDPRGVEVMRKYEWYTPLLPNRY